MIALEIRPDPDVESGASAYVDVDVAGTVVTALLDTGAGRSCVPRLPALRAASGETTATITGIAGTRPAHSATAPWIAIDGIVTRDVRVTVCDEQDGALLGLDVLATQPLVLRPACAELRLGALDDASCRDWHDLPGAGRHPHVDVVWGGLRVLAVWETGASASIVDPRLVHEHPQLFSAPRVTTGRDASGTVVNGDIVTMAPLTIGGRDFAASEAAVVPLTALRDVDGRPVDMIVGWPLIGSADWILDIPGRRWAFAG